MQILIIFLAVITLNLKIGSTRVLIIDNLNENIYFNYLFVTFCILILINGSNFIDGLNGLCLGYYSLVIIALMNTGIDSSIFLNHEKILIILTIFLILLLNNFLNLLFIGDGGAYVLGLIFSFNLINIYNLNSNISPFYIILLLWYPCFELLFSIIRKFNFRRSPIEPDTNHLHQLIFFFIRTN